MAPQKTLYQKRLEESRKNFKSKFKARPQRWLWTVREDEMSDNSTELSETDSEKAKSVPFEEDASLQGDISEMSEDERGIVAEYIRIQRRSRAK